MTGPSADRPTPERTAPPGASGPSGKADSGDAQGIRAFLQGLTDGKDRRAAATSYRRGLLRRCFRLGV